MRYINVPSNAATLRWGQPFFAQAVGAAQPRLTALLRKSLWGLIFRDGCFLKPAPALPLWIPTAAFIASPIGAIVAEMRSLAFKIARLFARTIEEAFHAGANMPGETSSLTT